MAGEARGLNTSDVQSNIRGSVGDVGGTKGKFAQADLLNFANKLFSLFIVRNLIIDMSLCQRTIENSGLHRSSIVWETKPLLLRTNVGIL